MLHLLFIGIMLLASIFLILGFVSNITKYKDLYNEHQSVSTLSQFHVKMIIQSNKAKIIGISIVMLSLAALFIGNMRIDNFTIQRLYPDTNFGLSYYVPTTVFTTAIVMVLNNIQIRKLMKFAKELKGSALNEVITKIATKEKIHNGFFILLSVFVSVQFLLFGFTI